MRFLIFLAGPAGLHPATVVASISYSRRVVLAESRLARGPLLAEYSFVMILASRVTLRQGYRPPYAPSNRGFDTAVVFMGGSANDASGSMASEAVQKIE